MEMNKNCCKPPSDCGKGVFKEVSIAIDALAPELNEIQRCVMVKIVEKTLKGGCEGKSEACKDGSQCCDKCQCGCRDNKPQSCCQDKGKESCCRECKDGCRCCDKCQCDCCEKGTCCKDKSKCDNNPKCCPSQCCNKCQCGCQVKDNSCKKDCRCCAKCKCGCNDKKEQEGCRKGGKCCGECKCGCKEGGKVGSIMKDVKSIVGNLLGSGKEKTFQMMKTAFDAYAKVEKRIPPEDFNKLAKKFSEKVAKLLCKMNKKSENIKEVQEKMAEKFWEKVSDKFLKKALAKGKELAAKLLFYKGNVCEEVACKGIAKAASQALCIAVTKKASSGKVEEEKKSSGGENAKGKKMKPKNVFEAKFISQFIDNNIKDALVCSKAIKEPVEKFLKETVLPCCVEKLKVKITPKIIANALLIPKAGKNDEFYVELANNYMKNLCFCDKKCMKLCVKLAKVGLLFSGMKEKSKIHVAAQWAAVMCCKVNGKIGCPKEICVEFLGKWIKGFTPIVEEGFKVLEELKEKLKDDENVADGRKMDKVCRRILLKYLKLYCIDGKFNKSDFKAQATSILMKSK